ncbi:MAG: hypothetical protein LBC96_03150 [Lachnospiraceae bacterium]|jgi:hypothetical protein|nr:hypothetical protein [Lachnospiraceae bacterium]
MQIAPVGNQPYIYNTNQVDAASLNRVTAIPADLEAERTDFTGLVGNDGNENPLRPGESADYEQIVESQMSLSERNAARIMPDGGNTTEMTAVVTQGESAVDTAATTNESMAVSDNATNTTTTSNEPMTVSENTTNTTTMSNDPGAILTNPTNTVTVNELSANTGNNNTTDTTATTNETGDSVFANVIPDELERPYTNAAVETAVTNAADNATALTATSNYDVTAATPLETTGATNDGTVVAATEVAPNTAPTETTNETTVAPPTAEERNTDSLDPFAPAATMVDRAVA